MISSADRLFRKRAKKKKEGNVNYGEKDFLVYKPKKHFYPENHL